MRVAKELEAHLRPIDDLVLLPGNPRQGDVGAISQSLERFGQLKPVVVDDDGVILAGNHTYLAARALGWEKIAAVVADELEGAEKSAFALADNRLSDLATYDDELLLAMASHVWDETGELAGTGYDVEDLKELESRRGYNGGEVGDWDTDEFYTPAWLFEVMGVEFDVDVAAAPGGSPHVPCKRWYSKDDDGLAHDWHGQRVWCNPPYSQASQWRSKFTAEVTEGLFLGPISSNSRSLFDLTSNASAVWMPIGLTFTRPSGVEESIRWPLLLWGYGEIGSEAVDNLVAGRPDDGWRITIHT